MLVLGAFVFFLCVKVFMGFISCRHSRYILNNIREHYVSSSDSEESNTSEHSSSQYTAGELLSSLSNPDITLNIDCTASTDEGIFSHQNV